MMKRLRFSIIWFVLMSMLLPPMLNAGNNIKVSLVTIYPGSEIYELYGHSELKVTDGVTDIYYNYGLFDFNAPGFASRFALGETDYLCGAIPAFMALAGYGERKVVEQELNLSPSQALRLCDMLAENALPQNAYYRYKFLSDNCATRPRDMIEKVIGVSFNLPQTRDEGHISYRDVLSQYTAHYAWQEFGIDLALGSGLDKTITPREHMFIPMVLMRAAAHTTVAGKPLVRATRVVNAGSDEGAIKPATPWWCSPVAVSCLLLMLVAISSWREMRSGRLCRWLDTLLYVTYALAGCVLFFLTFVSTHEATSPNFNVLWLHPFYVLPAVMVWAKRWHQSLLYYHYANLAEMLIFALVAPFLPQCFNVAFYVLMLVPMLRSINYIKTHRSISAS